MKTAQLTLKNGTTVEIITIISKNLFKVSYGKDRTGNDIVGIIFRECNKVTAPLRCKFIKTNGKQCLNASHKCDTLCKFHLNNKN